jgi:hypothetical protein
MAIPLGVVVGAMLAAATAAVPLWLRRKSPNEKERRRRELVTSRGRTIEGCAIDSTEHFVFYTYEWRGVRYEASQDVTGLIARDASADPISGPVTVKFLAGSPANSIVISEDWSGIPGVLCRKAVRQR